MQGPPVEPGRTIATFPAVLTSFKSGRYGEYTLSFTLSFEDKDAAWPASDFVEQIVLVQCSEPVVAARPIDAAAREVESTA